jgi:hypothetical protein
MLFVVMDASSDEDALDKCKEEIEAHGNDKCETIRLFKVGEEIEVPFYEWMREAEEEAQERKDRSELAKAEEKARQIREKLLRK